MNTRGSLNRREFLQAGGLGLSAAVLAACSARLPQATAAPTRAARPTEVPLTEPRAIIGDVLDFELSGDWPGKFGSVSLRLHEGRHNGQPVYFIRTDASDQDFAQANQLVYVPKLKIASRAPDSASASLYLFPGSTEEQLPILSTTPAMEGYSSLWQVHLVTLNENTQYDSADSLKEAEGEGALTIEATEIYVNFPVVRWQGGELPQDEARDSYLGTGQLLGPPDTSAMTATFKLHECFPGSRYIVTDTSAAPMAPMMSIAAAPPTQGLIGEDYDATDKIWVFGNGLEGSGVMGFQPAIFGHQAGDPVWSPFWNHFTLTWEEGVQPRVLTSAQEIQAALDAGEVRQWNGTPDTDPTGFIVNCPVPVLAPNSFAV